MAEGERQSKVYACRKRLAGVRGGLLGEEGTRAFLESDASSGSLREWHLSATADMLSGLL